jgi:hypothetical protein
MIIDIEKNIINKVINDNHLRMKDNQKIIKR